MIDHTKVSNDFTEHVGRKSTTGNDLEKQRAELRATIDRTAFEKEGLAWYRSAYSEAFVFMYDTSFYDREEQRYRIDEVLDDGEKEFGGYDIILLWQSYPRLGIDGRNQMDFYRDMPGGLEGLRKLTDRAHERGVKVFVNYNPWDLSTRREPGAGDPDPRGYRWGFPEEGRDSGGSRIESSGAPAVADAEALGSIIHAIGADGIFLDTMGSDDPGFRGPIEQANPDIVFDPEGVPGLESLGSITGSWLQRNAVEPPELLTIRWLEPRFSFRSIDRDSLDHQNMLHRSFFHGVGNVIWENIFGWWNPWNDADRALIRRCSRLLQQQRTAFQDENWQPYVETLSQDVVAHRWHDGDSIMHTMLNITNDVVTGPVIKLPSQTGDGRSFRHYDLWNGVEIKTLDTNNQLNLTMNPGEAGCIVSTPGELKLLAPEKASPSTSVIRDRVTLGDLTLREVGRSELAGPDEDPSGMCFVEGREVELTVRHNASAIMEGACYGGIETRHDMHHPPQQVALQSYWMDKTEVTNSEFQVFLKESQYVPTDVTNFLRHWEQDAEQASQPWLWSIPAGKEKHPVIWVDLDDARAYAKWAGKRLPTEGEWQIAAGFSVWPWGDQFAPDLCNSGTGDTTPVDQFPGGVSNAGCLDMAGNVWEWTESERDDGHTRFAILKGGSHLVVEGRWYNASGAQRNDVHEKILLMYPGLDRCGTIGFRCVKDTPS